MRRLLTAALASTLLAGLLPITALAGSTPQTITFGPLVDQTYGAAPQISASTDSSLLVTFTSTTTSVCTVGAGTLAGSTTTATVTILHTGSCTIDADQGGDGTFDVAPTVSATFTVNPAAQTVTADNQSITYGASDPAFTFTYGAWQNTDTAAVLTSPPTCGVSGAHTEVSGSPYQITCSGAAANDYTFTYNPGSLTINKANPRFSVSAPSLPYNGAPHAATGFAYGVIGVGEVLSPAVTFSYAGAGSTVYGPTATAPSQVGSYTVTASYAGNNDYNPGSSNAVAFGIGLHTQTITFNLSSVSKSFGDAAFSVASYASATSGLPVSFASQTTSVCTTSGIYGATVTLVGVGTCTIRASQNGDGYYSAATTVDQSFSVTLAGTLQIQHVKAVAPTVIDVLADPLLGSAIGGGKPLTILPNLVQATNGRVTTDGKTVTYEPNGCSTETDSFKFTVTDGVSTLQVPVAVIVDKPGVNGQPPTPMSEVPSVALTTGILGSTVPVRVAWCGVVGTSVTSYGLLQSSDGGATFAAAYTGTAPATVRGLVPSRSYAWKAQTTDTSLRVGTSDPSPSLRALLVQDSATSSIRFAGSWSMTRGSGYSGGTERYNSRTSASATFTAVGARGFAIVSSKGVGRGSLKVYVDGVLVATVSERASAAQYKRIIYARSLAYGATTSHTIKLVPYGNGRVDLDAIVTLR